MDLGPCCYRRQRQRRGETENANEGGKGAWRMGRSGRGAYAMMAAWPAIHADGGDWQRRAWGREGGCGKRWAMQVIGPLLGPLPLSKGQRASVSVRRHRPFPDRQYHPIPISSWQTTQLHLHRRPLQRARHHKRPLSPPRRRRSRPTRGRSSSTRSWVKDSKSVSSISYWRLWRRMAGTGCLEMGIEH